MIAIATSRSFLLCESVNAMSLDSDYERSGRTNDVILRAYTININYNPVARNNNPPTHRSDSSGNLTIKVIGESTALQLFRELVQQIREQCPDQPYLDKMVENILTGRLGETKDELDSAEVRRTRGPPVRVPGGCRARLCRRARAAFHRGAGPPAARGRG